MQMVAKYIVSSGIASCIINVDSSQWISGIVEIELTVCLFKTALKIKSNDLRNS